MPSSYFSGNKTNTGGAMFVTFNSKDQSVYCKIIKQVSWDDKSAKPSFTGGAVINLKLSGDEVGEFIHAVAGHTSCKFYHDFGGEVCSGGFTHWSKDFTGKDGKPANTQGFGFSIKKGDIQAKIGLSLGSAERFSQYLQFALNHMFSAIYAQDKKEFEDYLKKKETEKNGNVLVKKFPGKREEVPEAVAEDNIRIPELVIEGEDPLSW